MKNACVFQDYSIYLQAESYNNQNHTTMKKKRVFMLCSYPDEGFGSKSGTFYLLDEFGYKYGIMNEYDKVLGEMNKVVHVSSKTYSGSTIAKLIESIEEDTDSRIVRW